MSTLFIWSPTQPSQGCMLKWTSAATRVECDEIRFIFVSTHVGMDNVFTGNLVGRLSYYDAASTRMRTVTPTIRAMVGDQSQPSKFTIQGVIKIDRPINIQPGSDVSLSLGPFPITADGKQSITATQKWGFRSYFLRGNEIST